MFEPLPFYGGKILNYKQFFFYIFFLVLLSVIVVAGITDLALNISLWLYKRNRKRINPFKSTDTELDEGQGSINDAEEEK